MDTTITELVEQGYTVEEAGLVLRVTATAKAERKLALATGLCRCGQVLVRRENSLECLSCDAAHVA